MSVDEAALDQYLDQLGEQIAALPDPDPADVERTAGLLDAIRLDAAKAPGQGQPPQAQP